MLEVQLLDMVDNSRSLCKSCFADFFVSGQSGEVISPWSEAPFECYCWPSHHSPRHMTLHPHLASIPLKGKLAAMDERVPPSPSIVGSFSPLPWLGHAAGNVAPDGCPLVRVAAREPRAALHADAQNDSKHATTPDGRAGAGPVGKSPRCVVQGLLPHDGRSDSPVQ